MTLDPLAKISLRAEIGELERLNGWILSLCRHHEVPERVAFQLDVCLTELVTNIISYAYPDARPPVDAVTVQFAVRSPEIVVEVEDRGLPFDPLAYVPDDLPRSLEESQIGGRGLRLVRTFCEQMHYRREGVRNLLTLIFPVPPQ